jgi:hypothetical protein
MRDITCPYCEEYVDICHDDEFGFSEDVAHEMECSNCEKNFVFYTSISFSYDPRKADCLNGSPHHIKSYEGDTYKRDTCLNCEYEKYHYKEVD